MAGDIHAIPELDAKGYREFAITTGLIVAGLFGVIIPVLIWYFADRDSINWITWPWILCAVLVVWGLVAPTTLKPVYKGWMTFGLLVGTYIMTPLIMFLVFFGMFMPMGLIRRLFGKDSMGRKLDATADTYRVPSQPGKVKNLEKPF